MTFEDKLTLFLMIVAVFAVIIIIIVLVDMFLNAKPKKVIEVVEKEEAKKLKENDLSDEMLADIEENVNNLKKSEANVVKLLNRYCSKF